MPPKRQSIGRSTRDTKRKRLARRNENSEQRETRLQENRIRISRMRILRKEEQDSTLQLNHIPTSESVGQLYQGELISTTDMPHDQLHSMTLVYEWDITDIKIDEYGRWDDTRESEVFPLAGYHYGGKAKIDDKRNIYIQLMDYNDSNRPIDTTPMPKLTIVFKNQSRDTQAKQNLNHTHHSTDGIRTEFVSFDHSLDYGKNINDGWSRWSVSPFIRPPYLVSNGMKLRFYIEPPSFACNFFSNDGILFWRLDNYKERKQMELDGLIEYHESPYFYTSPQGYRVLIRLSLNGNTVWGWLWFVKGEFDSSLTQQFPHRFTVAIFKHTDQSTNLVACAEGEESHSTRFYFETASASLLESGGYVVDDSLLIKAMVEPLSIKSK